MLAWTKQNTMQRAMRTVLEWPQSYATSKTINMVTNKYEPHVSMQETTTLANQSFHEHFIVVKNRISRVNQNYAYKAALPLDSDSYFNISVQNSDILDHFAEYGFTTVCTVRFKDWSKSLSANRVLQFRSVFKEKKLSEIECVHCYFKQHSSK